MLADQIADALEHPDLRGVGRYARVRVEDAFTLHQQVGTFKAIYERAVGSVG
jgi:hypothetical protein